MDQRERYYDQQETLRMAIEARAARLWTTLPAVVQSYNAATQTLTAQPAINGRQKQSDGTWISLQMPIVVDVPVQWPAGGGATWTFPIQSGDECLLFIASRCIDAWFTHGFQAANTSDPYGRQFNPLNDPPEFRMHNLSDCFAIVGIRNQSRALASVSTTKAQLRTDDGTCVIEFDPVNKAVNLTAPGGINLNGVTIDSSGNLTSPGTVTGDSEVVAKTGASKVHLSTHTHTGGTISGDTGAPIAGS